MRIILYGGSGFIGINLARFFSKNSKNLVLIVSRSIISVDLPKNVIFADWNEFNSDIKSHLKNFDYFFYLVNTILPRDNVESLSIKIRDEKLMLNNIFDAASKSNTCLKFLYFSSGGAVYGNYSNKPFKESDSLNPLSCYGKIKRSGESEVITLSKKYLIDFIIVRPSNVYGIGQSVNGNQGVIAFFTDQIMKGLPLTVFGAGEGKKDYIYIDDFVIYIHKLILSNASGIFNIGSGHTASVNEIIKLIESKVSIRSRRKTLTLNLPDIYDFSLDCSHLKKTTSFSCKYSIKKGIDHYIESLQFQL